MLHLHAACLHDFTDKHVVCTDDEMASRYSDDVVSESHTPHDMLPCAPTRSCAVLMHIPRDMAATIDVVMMLTTHLTTSQTDSVVVYRVATPVRGCFVVLQVDISGHAASDLQQQLHDSQQQLQSKSHNAVPSLAVSLESQLRAQVSKSEYEVARQAAQILELQGELTKVQVSHDKSAQRQTETNAQLTRQESTASRFAASNSHLQEQLADAQITAASQENRISQLFSSLTDSNASMADAKQRSSQLEEELAVSRELSAEQKAEVGELKAQLSEQAAKAAAESASRAEADAGLHAQLKAESAKHKEDQGAWQEEVNGLQALAANAQKQKESLQTEVTQQQCRLVLTASAALTCAMA